MIPIKVMEGYRARLTITQVATETVLRPRVFLLAKCSLVETFFPLHRLIIPFRDIFPPSLFIYIICIDTVYFHLFI